MEASNVSDLESKVIVIMMLKEFSENYKENMGNITA